MKTDQLRLLKQCSFFALNKTFVISAFVILYCLCNPSHSLASSKDTLRVFFAVNSYVVSKSAEQDLDSLVNLTNKRSAIIIYGYGDNLGGKKLNDKLSLNRAQAVVTYLKSLHYTLSILPKGKGQILSTGDSKTEGNAQNRRVDIVFEKKNLTNAKNDKVVSAKDTAAVPTQNIDVLKFKRKTDSLSIMEVGGRLSIDELTFRPGSHFLDSASTIYLKILTQYLIIHKSLVFEIRGHVCCTPVPQDGFDVDALNHHLSQNRAREIYFYFLKNGIEPKRMTVTGVGSSEPRVSPEITPHDQQLNRRVEIIILQK